MNQTLPVWYFDDAINLRNEDIPILIEKLNQWISKIS